MDHALIARCPAQLGPQSSRPGDGFYVAGLSSGNQGRTISAVSSKQATSCWFFDRAYRAGQRDIDLVEDGQVISRLDHARQPVRDWLPNAFPT